MINQVHTAKSDMRGRTRLARNPPQSQELDPKEQNDEWNIPLTHPLTTYSKARTSGAYLAHFFFFFFWGIYLMMPIPSLSHIQRAPSQDIKHLALSPLVLLLCCVLMERLLSWPILAAKETEAPALTLHKETSGRGERKGGATTQRIVALGSQRG